MINTILEECSKIFRKDISALSPETRLNEDLGAISANFFALIAVIEDLTDEEISFGQIRKCQTIADVAALAESLK